MKESGEKKVAQAVIVHLIISINGAIHKDTVKRRIDFAPDIQVDWVLMAQSVLRYNVVIVWKFFKKGSWVSEAWRKNHQEEFEEEPKGPPERIATAEERREKLHIEPGPELMSAVCGVRARHLPKAFG